MAVNFGIASQYNAFILGNMSMSNTDAEGRVAVEGNATLTDYGIGSNVLPLPPFGTDNSFVIGGNVNVTAGTNACGNTVASPTSVVTNYSMGNPNGTFTRGTPIDFAAATTYLTSISAYWGSLAANGTGNVQYGQLTLTGTSTSLNIFSVNSSNVAGSGLTLAGINGINIVAPAASTILINVTGTNIAFGSYQIFRNGSAASRTDALSIVWNFPQAQTWTNSTTGIYGSVLAPLATATTTYSQINGNIVFANMTGNAECHNELFTGTLPDLPVTPKADVYITKTDSPHPVSPGGLLTYTITVGNNGPNKAVDVKLTDNIASVLSGAQYSLTGSSPWTPWTGSLNLGDIASGSSVTVTIQATLANTATDSVQNVATAYSSTTFDPNLDNNMVTISTTIVSVPGSADIYVVKAASSDTVEPGQTLTYTITVGNNGPDTSQNVTLADSIPSALLNAQYSLTGGAPWTPWTGSLSLGNIAKGAAPIVVTIQGIVDMNATQTIINSAVVSSKTPDPNVSNNMSSTTTKLASADIYVTKKDSPDPVAPGGTLTYTILVGNNGPDTSQSVVLTDAIPSTLLNAQYSLTGGAPWTTWTGSLNLGNLIKGSSQAVTIQAMVAGTATGTIINTAAVSSQTQDPNTGNNMATINTTIQVPIPSADIYVTKIDSPDPVEPGQTLTYTIAVGNNGPDTAQSVVLTDSLPSTLLNAQYSLTGSSPWTPWTGSLSIGNLTKGSSQTVTIQGTVASSATGTIMNTATVASQTQDPNMSNNVATANTTIQPLPPSADIYVTKADSPNPVEPSGTLTYTIVVGNNGPDTAQSVVLTDSLPSTLLNAQYSLTGGAPWTTWTGSLSIGNLAKGSSQTVTIQGTVASSATGMIMNTATVASQTQDPNMGNNVATTNTTIQPPPPSADIYVTKTDSPDPVQPGQTLTYTIVVGNNGPDTAQSVVLTDSLPSTLLNAQYSLTGSSPWTPWTGSLTVGNLAKGSTQTVTIQGEVASSATGTIVNTAIVASQTHDPETGNNTVTTDTTIQVPVPSADIYVTKTDSPDPVEAGSTLTYTIKVGNNGPDTATDVILTDSIASVLSNVEYSLTGSSPWTPWTGSLTVGNLAKGSTQTVTIQGTVASSATGTIMNTATVASQTQDPDTSNNIAKTDTAIQVPPPSADIFVTKTDSPDPVVAGGTLTYTIVVGNNGPDTAESVVLTDTLPSTLLNGEYTLTGSSPWTPWTGSVTIGNLAKSTSQIVTIRAAVDKNATGTIINTATVASQTQDPDTSNNMATSDTAIQVPVPSADIYVTKKDSPDPVEPGQTLTYTIVVGNNGPDTATDVILTDSIASVLSNVEYSLTGSSPWTPWTGSLTVGNLAKGSSQTVTIQGVVASTATGTIVNTATVATTVLDPDTSNNMVTVSTAIQPPAPSADIYVTKKDSPDPVQPGGTLTYTIVVGNNGPDTAQKVVLTDSLASTLLNAEYSLTGSAPWMPWTGSLDIGDLTKGSSQTVTIQASVASSATGTIINTATVASQTQDPDTSNNMTTIDTTIQPPAPSADIYVAKSDSPDPVEPGQTLTYTIVVGNNGPDTAENVVLTDSLATTLLNAEYSLTGSSPWTPWTGSLNLGNLTKSSTKTITIQATVAAAATGTIINTATVASQTQDPDTSNNTVTTDTTIQVPAPSADIYVTKEDTPDPVAPGEILTYTIGVGNNGPDTAPNVVLTDTIASVLSNVEYSLTGAAPWTPWTGSLDIGDVTKGSHSTITIRATVDSSATGTIINTATVSSGATDPNTSNNTVTIDTTIQPPVPFADIYVTKVDTPDPVAPDEMLTYTIVVGNNGPDTAQNVVLTDTIASVLSNVEYSLTGAAPWTPWTGSLTVGDLTKGSSQTITIQGKVDSTAIGTIMNTATVASQTKDPNMDNNMATTDTTIQPPAPSADIYVTKVDTPDPVEPGETLTYTIGVGNNGPDTAQNVILTDSIASTLLNAEYSLTGSAPWTPWTGSLDIGNLTKGSHSTITIQATVADTATGNIINTATVASQTKDPDTSNNMVTIDTTIQVPVPSADIYVTKTDSPDPVAPDGTLTYTIEVGNNGPDTAKSVVLTDHLASTLLNAQYSLTGSAPWMPWTGSLDIGDLTKGSHSTITIQATVANAATGTIINTATVASETQDPDMSNNMAATDTTIQVPVPVADIYVTKTGSPDPVAPEGTLTYAIEVGNNGPDTAQDVVLTDDLASTLLNGEYSLTGSAPWTPWTGSLNIGNLTKGSSKMVTIRAAVDKNATGMIRNTATVASQTQDPDMSNNIAVTDTTIQVPVPVADIYVTKTDSPDPVAPGGTLTYAIEVGNNGPDTAKSVVLTDHLASTLLNAQYSLTGSAPWMPWTGSLDIGDLTKGSHSTITIQATVANAATGTIINTATVASETQDPDMSNNMAATDTTIQVPVPVADIYVTKTGSPDPVAPEGTLTYAIEVGNNGPDTAQDVVLTDDLASTLLNGEYSLTGSAPWTPWTGSLNIGNLTKGSSKMVTIRAAVDKNATGMIRNTATVASQTQDPDMSNNIAVTDTTIQQPAPVADIYVTKTDSPDPVEPDGILQYVIEVGNNGPDTAENVILTDHLAGTLLNAIYSLTGSVPWMPWTGSLNVGNLTKGSSQMITIRAAVDKNATGMIRNTVTVASQTQDPDMSNNIAATDTTIQQPPRYADVYVTKADIPDPVAPGGTLMYTISVGNNGPDTAKNVILTDSLASTLLNAEYSLTGSAPWMLWTGNLDIGDLTKGSYRTIIIKATVDNGATGTIINTAIVSSQTQDPDTSNNMAITDTTIQKPIPYADIYVTKTDSPNPVDLGGTLTYTIGVGNNGPDTAQNVVLTDQIASGLSNAQYSLTGSAPWMPWTGSLNIGDMANGASYSVTIRASVDNNAGCQIMNKAQVSSDTLDTNYSNNEAVTDTTISACIGSHVQLAKAANVAAAIVGDVIVYTLKLTNLGPNVAQNVKITDALPADLTYNDHLTLNGGSIPGDITSGVNIGDVPVGTVTLTYEAIVKAVPQNEAHQIINQASAAYVYQNNPNEPPIPATVLSNPETVTVVTVGFSVEKKADVACVSLGDSFNYIIQIMNTGAAPVDDVTVTDLLPAGFTVIDISLDGKSISGDLRTGLNIGSIPGHTTEKLTVNVRVDSSNIGSYNNEVRTEGVVNIDPNRIPALLETIAVDKAGIKIYNLDLSLVASADKQQVVVGDIITYTIAATNVSDGILNNVPFKNVIVSDILAEDIEFISGSVVIDDISMPQESIIAGINLGTLGAGETKVIQFKAKVISLPKDGIIVTAATGEFVAQFCTRPATVRTSTSNEVKINVYDIHLQVNKKVDKEEVSLGETLTYTVTMVNDGDLTVYNVHFTDTLPHQVMLIPGSFKLDGKVVNGVELEKGITISSIIPKQTVVITYQVKVIGSKCTGEIINNAVVTYDYRLDDGTSGTLVDDTNSTVTQLTISTFKQLSSESYLEIPAVKPDIEEIQNISGSVDCLNCHVIQTPVASSIEGQFLTGYKLIVRGNLSLSIEYTALEPEQTMHSAHYSIPFSTFIILPTGYVIGSRLQVEGLIEDIYYQVTNMRSFFVNVTSLINVKILC